ncbi:MAG: glyoxalase [Corynebacteriales bacterium]|nr:glyoxalase [Mycobacteriales bacterium]
MPTMVFPNIPVRDVPAARAFYTSLGFAINEDFSDEHAACIVVTDNVCVMAVNSEFFLGNTTKALADTKQVIAGALAIAMESREAVDKLVDAALSSGGTAVTPTTEMDGFYSRNFYDLDGHQWDILHMG